MNFLFRFYNATLSYCQNTELISLSMTALLGQHPCNMPVSEKSNEKGHFLIFNCDNSCVQIMIQLGSLVLWVTVVLMPKQSKLMEKIYQVLKLDKE